MTAASTPRATLRLQLHKDFPFAAATELVPYLADLGVSHLYASPIMTATPGSLHGYDVTDPTRINPELGGEDGFRALVATLREHRLGIIVDIVPNHMAVGGAGNAWWHDVLQHGPESRYAAFFDIDWNPADPALQGKVLAPFLGRSYGEALDAGEIKLARASDGTPHIAYFDNIYPIHPRDYAEIETAGVAAYDPGHQDGRARLHRLLERQHYRLAWWGAAGDEINWRRFFDINGLAGLRIESPEVFEATHATLFRLYAEGLIDGFRIDHVDGLSDPPGYCRRLRARLQELESHRPEHAPKGPGYIVVEKILGAGERLPSDWAVDGTSGYDFMDAVSLLQHDNAAAESLGRFWSEISGRSAGIEAEEILARHEILERAFEAQLNAAVRPLHALARIKPETRDITAAAIRHALIALLAHFRVYRTYGAHRSAADDAAFGSALDAAKTASPSALHPVLDHLSVWLGGVGPRAPGEQLQRVAATRFQQLSAPVAAKAVEDTAFYRYGRLLSRNDVGFEAARLGSDADTFHRSVAVRANDFPHAMLATATHDHKRGEDVRARLAVLSELPDAWEQQVRAWMHANAQHRSANAPSPGDEAMLYQMIVGAWPLNLQPHDEHQRRAFIERIAAWQLKAMREAKLATNWTAPDTQYEEGARNFLYAIMNDTAGFAASAAQFVDRIAPAGAVNGLAQTLLKLTVPGVPDIYQGAEFWDLSLVDPDNRRPVDFAARRAARTNDLPPMRLTESWRDGRVKQAVIARVLALRSRAPAVFADGAYHPLAATGPRARHVVAFLRANGAAAALAVVPRLPLPLLPGTDSILFKPDAWGDTTLRLPASAHGEWRDVLTGAHRQIAGALRVADILTELPIALLSRIESA